MLKLKSLTIHKYRYDLVRPGATLRFHDGVNVLLGKNGSGKTTLLNLIAMVLGACFAGLEEEVFDIEYEMVSGNASYTIHIRNELHDSGRTPKDNGRAPKMSFEMELRAEQPTRSLLTTLIPDTERPEWLRYSLRVADGRVVAGAGDTRLEADLGGVSPFVPDRNFIVAALDRILDSEEPLAPPETVRVLTELAWTAHFLSEHYWSPNQGYERFDEATAWMERVQSKASLLCQQKSPPSRFHLPIDILGDTHDLEAQIDRDSPPPTLAGSSAAVPLLAAANSVLGFRETSFRMDLTNIEATATPRRYFYGNLRFYFKKNDGSLIPFERLSFGQKRLFGYFHYLGLHQWFAVADELANGMHHSMIADCLEALGPRQAFLATQNPLLLDHLPFATAEEMISTFVLCEPVIEGDREHWVWRHLTADEADDLFRDYQVGVQHTNDLLRTRGLW